MRAHTIKRVQKIPVSLDIAWKFFSHAGNLAAITPAGMGFTIISKHQAEKMHAGQIIEYSVKPFLGIPLYWMTEISQVREKEYFLDVQRQGPYKLWHHQHSFKEIPGGVEMTDIIHYKIPGGIFGRMANRVFVKNKLGKIFDYRYKKIEELLGGWAYN